MSYIETLAKLRRAAIRWAVIYAVIAVLLIAATLVFASSAVWPALAISAIVWGGFAVFWTVLAHKDKEKINEEQARIDRRATGGYVPGSVAGAYTGPYVTAAQIQQYYGALAYIAGGGGYWGGTQAHRTGTGGSTGNGPGGSTSGGTGTRVTQYASEFAGVRHLEEAGFAAGVVRGTRSFGVDPAGMLRGVVYGQKWEPGENTARCLSPFGPAVVAFTGTGYASVSYFSDSLESGRPPHDLTRCNHGFYGYYDGSNDYHQTGMVSAVIEGYGECVIGTRGFRCTKARIIALHIPDTITPDLAALIRTNYPDIPVCSTFEQMVAEFPPDSGETKENNS